MKKGTFVILASMMLTTFLLPGCGGGSDDARGTLNIIAGVSSDGVLTLAVVTVYKDGFIFGTPVENATVTINGTSVTHTMMGMYQGDLTGLVSSGDTLHLNVQYIGASYTSSVTMPYQPTVNDPAPLDETTNETISWFISTMPQFFDIGIDDTFTTASGDYEGSELGSATTHMIPLDTVGSGEINVEITVDAINSATIPGADAFSGFAASFTGTSSQFDT